LDYKLQIKNLGEKKIFFKILGRFDESLLQLMEEMIPFVD